MHFTSAVVLAGQIASGKSSVAKHLAVVRSVPLVSFGILIRTTCQRRGIAATRVACQDVGAGLGGCRPGPSLPTLARRGS